MKIKNILYLFIMVSLFSCNKKEDIDTVKPTISLDFPEAFPVTCDTLYFGESFVLKMRFKDNIELGSYSIDIHNNFDHHTHSTEVSECIFGPIKVAVNPFVFINDYNIPTVQSDYLTNVSITIPSGNGKGKYDEGDYHFYISLTDKEGWSVQKGLSVKILHR